MNATPPESRSSTYAAAGVDEEREQVAFARVMRPWLARTKVKSPLVTSITGLASGYFATLMHLPPGPPLALTTDGVGFDGVAFMDLGFLVYLGFLGPLSGGGAFQG